MSVEVRLCYLDPRYRNAKFAGHARPELGGRRQDAIDVPVVVQNGRVRDAASAAVREQVHNTGFALTRLDEDELASVSTINVFSMNQDQAATLRYFRAMESLVLRTLGASYVRAYQYAPRRSSIVGNHTLQIGDSGARGAVNDVHCDFASGGPAERQHRELAKRLGLSECRLCLVNAWRNVGTKPVSAWPLAVCDASSVAQEDLVARTTPENDNLIYAVLPSPRHRWYFFPEMQSHEVLLFKQLDTDLTAKCHVTPHTAFPLPTPGEARESCEVRLGVYYDKQGTCTDALLQLHRKGVGQVAKSVIDRARPRL